MGNRASATDAAGTNSYVYDQANRLTLVDAVVYQLDAYGDLLSDGSSSCYTYDANRLSVRTKGTSTTTFAYEASATTSARPQAPPRHAVPLTEQLVCQGSSRRRPCLESASRASG